ncbi:flagellar basal body rod protein FlgC [Salisediminibacterium beveridgei]|uniref:Flagellar basal-body rod protein FlgC n=1 Tax=Salisediminibacterium beveridgei TaxID=632773 RepID=A0A1D7QW08_9BACI|nr:flagellar basal body rod protein FlgC [Salisediminibacterium beveridgei]AOM83192.1 Flagellar basal-body rod protein FlgC [Salisediminibacterium beveridgei]
MFHGMNVSASGLTSQRLRMDVVSANMANAESTRGRNVDGEWEPYRRKMVTLESNKNSGSRFQDHFQQAVNRTENTGEGVKVGRIIEDQSPFRQQYQPEHPDANEEGYVELPNVDPLKEMMDLMSATRSYEAGVTSFDAHKNMLMKALELGR